MVMKIGPRRLAQLALLGTALLPGGMSRAQQPSPPAAGDGIVTVDLVGDGKAETVEYVVRPTVQYVAIPISPSDLHVIGSDTGFGASDPDTIGLGATLGQADRAVRAQLGLPDDRGLVVWSLTPQGPAARAGLLEQDILLSLDGKLLNRPKDLVAGLKAAGDKAVPLALIRAGKPMTLQVKPEYRVSFIAVQPEKTEYSIGVAVKAIDATLRAHLPALAGVRGLVVDGVAPDSPGAKAGLKLSDILISIGDAPVTDFDSLATRIQATGGKTVPVKILREGKPMTIEVTPAPRKKAPLDALATDGLVSPMSQRPPSWHIEMDRQWLPLYYDELLRGVAPANRPSPGAADSDRVGKRLDALDQELKQLRASIEALRKTLKPDDKPGGERR